MGVAKTGNQTRIWTTQHHFEPRSSSACHPGTHEDMFQQFLDALWLHTMNGSDLRVLQLCIMSMMIF